MPPPRRHRSSSNVSNNGTTNIPTNVSQPPRIESPALARQQGMTPAIYENNMKVLRRREPSIISIFDQFSHVCLYHHNGSKWEKQGFEGSMFLFEKKSYPYYGFFILNRMGTDDYIRPLYPEDDMEISGDIVMIRFYPEFTSKRVQLGLPYPIPKEHRAMFYSGLSADEFENNDPANTRIEKIGTSVTVGLWMFSTDSREPLKDVMMRLHSYIKAGKRYPDEFRYGLGRQPPPNPHSRTPSRTSVTPASQGLEYSNYNGTPRDMSTPASNMNGAGSDLDKLFSKLMPSTAAPAPPPEPSQSTRGMSIQGILSTLGGQSAQQPSPAPPASANRGIALLDSIFASATPSTSSDFNQNFHFPQQTQAQPRQESFQIVSPKPTSIALPQILNQDVIATLLGLGVDSRASSSADSRRDGVMRYEGDNEFSEGEGASEVGYNQHAHVGGAFLAPTSRRAGRAVQGDVTPRAPPKGIDAVVSPQPLDVQPANASQQQKPASTSSPPAPRKLVPFEADSDLWPYPRAQERAAEDGDVVELDFADTRALSDPAMFSSRLREKNTQPSTNGKKKTKKERAAEREREREEIERGWDDPVKGEVHIAPVAHQPALTAGSGAVNGKEKQKSVNGTPRVNGDGKGKGAVLDGEAARRAVVATVAARGGRPAEGLPRNEFVRELLTLIHTDKQFVDDLWQDYRARTT